MTYVIVDDMALLDILILSNLRAGPVHGYELKNRVQRPTAAKLSNNSLYPILRRFEAGGAVSSVLETQEGRPARTIYSITERGLALLTELISTLPAPLAGNEEEFLARLNFFHEVPLTVRHEILNARVAALAARREQVLAVLADAVGSPTGAWRALAMEHLLADLDRDTHWVEELRTLTEPGPTQLPTPINTEGLR